MTKALRCSSNKPITELIAIRPRIGPYFTLIKYFGDAPSEKFEDESAVTQSKMRTVRLNLLLLFFFLFSPRSCLFWLIDEMAQRESEGEEHVGGKQIVN